MRSTPPGYEIQPVKHEIGGSLVAAVTEVFVDTTQHTLELLLRRSGIEQALEVSPEPTKILG